MNQGTPSVGLAGVMAEPYNRGVSAEDLYKMEMVKRAQEANYQRALEEMRGAKVTDGKIDPAYWDAAQKASDYELRGLAGRAR